MNEPTPIYFNDLASLARLPYFDVDHGRLVVADKRVGASIDMHTHLALAYARPIAVDLQREHPQTEYYFPACSGFDLERYANENFTPKQLKTLSRDLSIKSVTAGGMRRTHTRPNLERDMRDLGIAHSVVLPIELFSFMSRNTHNALEATRGHGTMVCFGSVHPYDRHRDRLLEEQAALGVRGIKLHPNVQSTLPSSDGCMAVYRACEKHQIPVLIHCGPVGIEPPLGRYLSQVRHYEHAIRENPGVNFVLGHAGARQPDAALDLQRRYKNVYLETSSQGLPALRRMLRDGDPERIVYGTDWPFYHQAMALAKLLIATEGQPALRRKVLFDNAARLLRLDRARMTAGA